MKFIFIPILISIAYTKQTLKQEIQQAFLHFDKDQDGLVTRKELKDGVIEDLANDVIEDERRKEIFDAIDKMTDDHDVDQDGLDFKEMYKASGGKLEDL